MLHCLCPDVSSGHKNGQFQAHNVQAQLQTFWGVGTERQSFSAWTTNKVSLTTFIKRLACLLKAIKTQDNKL
jgi:hypothetical protein